MSVIPLTQNNTVYIPVMETPYQVIRLDNIAGEQHITVYNVPISHIDDLIAKLQTLKAETHKPEVKAVAVPFPVEPAKIEPEEHPVMTAVLGPKPDPTRWYANALHKATVEKQKHIELPTPPMPKPHHAPGVLNVIGVPTKHYRTNGYDLPSKSDEDYNADIVKNKSIRIYGIGDMHQTYDKATDTFTSGKPAFDLTFKIGDYVVYGSYNLVYTGKIIAIGEKTVKIKHYENSDKVTQLDLHTFIRRNWDYDAEKILKRNSEWSD